MKNQICMFEYCPSLIPDNASITDLQLEKLYSNFFKLKREKKKHYISVYYVERKMKKKKCTTQKPKMEESNLKKGD